MRKLIQFLFMSKSERIKKAKYKNIIESKDGHDNYYAMTITEGVQKEEHRQVVLNSKDAWNNYRAMEITEGTQKEEHRLRVVELGY